MTRFSLTLSTLLLAASSAYAQTAPPATTPGPAAPPTTSANPVGDPNSGGPAVPDNATTPDQSETTPGVATPAETGAVADPAAQAVDPAAPAVAGEEMIDPALFGGGGGGAALSAAELEELGFAATVEEAVDTDIKVYGFADVTFAAALAKQTNGWRRYFANHPSFLVGNFNVYFGKNLSETVRFLGEVRFHYMPNGSPGANLGEVVYTSNALDYNDYNRTLRWGGIRIERLYLEWSLHRYANLRFGSWLTPYGIWNVDHGTPTFVTIGKPYIIGNQLFPERQSGIELFGRWEASAYNNIGYHLTVSNGTGPTSEFRDWDNNKAVGGRLYWSNRRLGELRMGTSAYYGTDTNAQLTYAPTQEAINYGERINSQSKVLSLALDAQWRYGGWHLQTEWIASQRNFTQDGRVPYVHRLTGQTLFPQDNIAWGGYVLLGYRFQWYGVMPFYVFQTFDQIDPATNLKTEMVSNIWGVNIRASDAVTVKVAVHDTYFYNGHYLSNDPFRILFTQLAWAF